MKVRRVDFYPDEWLAGTAELSEFDRGVYITICALIYSRGERIDVELLKRHAQCHGNALRSSLERLEAARKIVRKGSEIGQKRSENELETVRKRLRNASENGSRGNEIKKLQAATRGVNGHANYQLPLPRSLIKEPPKEAPRKRGVLSGEFEQFWEAYPHKVGKGAAKQKFETARRDIAFDELMAGVERYVAQRRPDQPWCNPSTWLHQQRWLDQPAAVSLKGQPSFPNGLASADEDVWRRRLRDYAKSKFWNANWGFTPDDPDCYAPPALLIEFGFSRARHAVS